MAVDAANLTVDKPCMIGIIGQSGAGKSTLLRTVNRLADATEGSITFDGRNVTQLTGTIAGRWVKPFKRCCHCWPRKACSDE